MRGNRSIFRQMIWIKGDRINIPKKKPKNKELWEEEKENNKIINSISIRIKIKHMIGKLKIYKMIWWVLRIIWNYKTVKMNLKQKILFETKDIKCCYMDL